MNTYINDFRTIPKFLLLSVASGLVLAPLFNWVTMLLALGMLASVGVFGLGIFARMGLALLMYGTLGAAAMQITSLLSLQMNFALLHTAFLVLAFLYAATFRDRIDVRSSVTDILGAGVGLAVFVVLAAPFYGSTTSRILESLIGGEDNNSHLQLFRYTLVEKHYAFHNDIEQAGIRPSLLSYAQGSHAAMATVASPFVENSSRGDQLKAYVYSAAGVFAMVFWFVFLAITRPLARIKDLRLQLAIGSLGALSFVVYVPLGVFLSLYNFGYYPQNLAYLALAALLLVVIASATVVKKKADANPRLFLLEVGVLLLAFYGIYSSWYLLAPVAVPILLAYLWVNRERVVLHKWKLFVLTAPIALLCLHLTYVYLFMTTGVGHLLTPAGVVQMKARLLLICVPAVFLGIIFFRRRQWYIASIAACLLAAGGMALLIGLYQIKKIQHFDYYFYKTLFTVLFLALIYYGYLFTQSLSDALGAVKPKTTRSQPVVWPVVGLLLVTGALIFYSPPKHLKEFVATKRAIPQTEPRRLLDVYTNEAIYEKYSDVITLYSCNPYTNFTGTLWGGSYFLSYNDARGKLENDLLKRNNELSLQNSPLLDDIDKYAAGKNKPVAVVIGEVYCANENTGNIMQQLSNSKNVRMVDLRGELISDRNKGSTY